MIGHALMNRFEGFLKIDRRAVPCIQLGPLDFRQPLQIANRRPGRRDCMRQQRDEARS